MLNSRNWLCCAILLLLISGSIRAQDQELDLWYEEPAQQWVEALPIGNGSFGGMIFGGVNQERIQLNEESVWTGFPIERANPEAKAHLDTVRSLLFSGNYEEAERLAQEKIMGKRLPGGKHTYQTLGNLHLDFAESSEYSDYRREVDLNTALASVTYKQSGTTYSRELFSSFPDQVIAMKMAADRSGKISFSLKLNRPGSGENVQVKDEMITMSQKLGSGQSLSYTARAKVILSGGTLATTDSSLTVTEADEVVLLLAAATDFRGDNPEVTTEDRLHKAAEYSYDELKERHVEDYQELFDRVDLDLTPGAVSNMPTDQRLERVKEGGTDPHLTELYFQYGRYMLISSSRPGTLPANLQGLWAEGLTPPWNADYHININIQMNYWPSDLTNLSETGLPFYDFMEGLNERGSVTAEKVYGSRGMVAHHTTDIWQFTDPIGQAEYGMWPMGGAWVTMHFWDHYQFTGNKDFLRERGYPQLKKAALFFVDYLVEDPESGYLVTGPSMSPENKFITPAGNEASVTMGPTMDMQILHELFSATIQAADILGTDEAFKDTLQNKMTNLAPIQIGSDGTIMEWRRDFEEADPGHRHISHLYSLYPGNAINEKDTPDLLEAAENTIDRRLSHGGGHTGWSRAWIINFFSRLKDSEKSHDNLLALYRKSTLPNLFDTHPPFQIDGNFGGTAGIAEMLLQSHAGYIELLPALPAAWPEGKMTGLKARGGVIVDLFWDDGTLEEAVIKAEHSGSYEVRYQEKKVMLELKAGEEQTLIPESFAN